MGGAALQGVSTIRYSRQHNLFPIQKQPWRPDYGLGVIRSRIGAGIAGRIYTHPIGYHGHGAGPMIGRYDNQVALPGTGDATLHDDTLFSFEMYCRGNVAEWDGQSVMLATEQIVAFTEGRVAYMGGRQERLHII